MWRYIKLLLLALVFGMGFQQIDTVAAKGFPMTQDQSYVASDAGVPTHVVLIIYTTQTLEFRQPDHMHLWINNGAKLVGIVAIAETVERSIIPKDHGYRINNSYANIKLSSCSPSSQMVSSYKDFHINWCS